MTAGAVMVGLGLALLLLTGRVPARGARAMLGGLAVLVLAAGAIAALSLPGAPFTLPGYGPRAWHSP